MALFKIFKGSDSTKLTDSSATGYKTPTDGYAYYDTSTKLFYIDAAYDPASPTTISRAAINADSALKWNGVALAKLSSTNSGDSTYVPLATSTSPINMSFTPVKKTPTSNAIAKYDANSYLYSTTPSASDNSTKVATTLYVDAVADDKTWNGVTLNKTGTILSSQMYLAARTSTSATTAYLVQAVMTPTSGQMPLYSSANYTPDTTPTNAYLLSTTPSANDNSTKVATTAYVDSALNNINFSLDYGQVLPLTGEEGDVFLQISDDPAGTSVPLGGTTGLALVKLSNDDGDAGWAGPYVAKVGDTMTGTLNTLTNLVTTVPSSALDSYQVIRLADSVNAEVGGINAEYSPNTNRGICIYADKEINNTAIYNSLSLAVRDDGTKAVYVSDPVAWRDAMSAVNKAGDTMTGDLTLQKSTSIANNSPARLSFNVVQTDNSITSYASIRVYDDGDTAANGTNMVIQSAGNVIIGGGESPSTIYTNAIKGKTVNANISAGALACEISETGENLILTADSAIYFLTNCNSSSGANRNLSYLTTNGYLYTTRTYGAVWNDYAEFRQANSLEPGRCVIEQGDDTLTLSTERMQPGAEIISDTFGFAIGETEKAKTPIATTGRVLAYPYEDRELFRQNIGKPICSGPEGTVSIMTDEEYAAKGYCAIGFISAVPDYEEWGDNHIKVDGRVWIRVR